MIALVATVVAWTTKPTCGASTSASASARSTACMNPSDGSAGVSACARAARPVGAPGGAASVRAPPMSTAIRTLIVEISNRNSVDVARALRADLALADVAADELRVTLLGRPVAAAAAGAHADHVARLELDGDLRAEPRLDAVPGVDVLRDVRVVAAARAPGAEAVAVGEDRIRRRAVEDVVLAQAEPAAEAAGAVGVRHEREAPDPHRVVELRLLDRR